MTSEIAKLEQNINKSSQLKSDSKLKRQRAHVKENSDSEDSGSISNQFSKKMKKRDIKKQDFAIAQKIKEMNAQQFNELPKTVKQFMKKSHTELFAKFGQCHQCKAKSAYVYGCFKNWSPTSCKPTFCLDCLMGQYKENPVLIVQKQSEWKCPFKRKICTCSACKGVPEENALLTGTGIRLDDEDDNRFNELDPKPKLEFTQELISQLFGENQEKETPVQEDKKED